MPIYKKGDSNDCGKCRGIPFLSTAVNILKMIRTAAEYNLNVDSEDKEHIFAMTRKRFNRRGFVDPKKAFNRAPRTVIRRILRE